MIFTRSLVQDVIRESAKTITSSDDISENIVRQDLKFRPKVQTDLFSNGIFCWLLKLRRENVLVKIPRLPVLDEILELAKTLTSSDHISEKIARQDLKFRPRFRDILSQMGFFLVSEMSQKKIYRENATMTCLEQRNPRIQSSDTKCQETSS